MSPTEYTYQTITAACIAILCTTAGCGPERPQVSVSHEDNAPNVIAESEACPVLEQVLDHLISLHSLTDIVIERELSSPAYLSDISVNDVPIEMMAVLTHQAGGSKPFSCDLNPSVNSIVREQSETRQVIQDGGWPAFYERYSTNSSLIHLSQPVIDRVGTLSIVFVSISIGPWARHEYIVVLRRRAGQWLVEKKVIISLT